MELFNRGTSSQNVSQKGCLGFAFVTVSATEATNCAFFWHMDSLIQRFDWRSGTIVGITWVSGVCCSSAMLHVWEGARAHLILVGGIALLMFLVVRLSLSINSVVECLSWILHVDRFIWQVVVARSMCHVCAMR